MLVRMSDHEYDARETFSHALTQKDLTDMGQINLFDLKQVAMLPFFAVYSNGEGGLKQSTFDKDFFNHVRVHYSSQQMDVLRGTIVT